VIEGLIKSSQVYSLHIQNLACTSDSLANAIEQNTNSLPSLGFLLLLPVDVSRSILP
jgi:hypothetical protein